MKKNKIMNVAILGVLAITVMAFAISYSFPVITQKEAQASVGEHGQFLSGPCIQIKINGNKIPLYCNLNTVTNIGKNQTRDMLMNNTQNWIGPVKYLELSTDANPVNATISACPGVVTASGLAIATGATAIVGGSVGNYSITYTWTAGAAQSNIYKMCLGNTSVSTSANMLFASAWINQSAATPINLAIGDQITGTYYIAVT
jgi:hypothetical protein